MSLTRRFDWYMLLMLEFKSGKHGEHIDHAWLWKSNQIFSASKFMQILSGIIQIYYILCDCSTN